MLCVSGMKMAQESYKDGVASWNGNHGVVSWSGLSPVFANEWGVYPAVNWVTLGGKQNWSDE